MKAKKFFSELGKHHGKKAAWALTMLVWGSLIAAPALAAGGGVGSLCTNANQALQWIEIGVYFILVVAVLGSAVMAAFGRMEWKTVGMVLIGAIIAGVAVPVVTALSGLSGC